MATLAKSRMQATQHAPMLAIGCAPMRWHAVSREFVATLMRFGTCHRWKSDPNRHRSRSDLALSHCVMLSGAQACHWHRPGLWTTVLPRAHRRGPMSKSADALRQSGLRADGYDALHDSMQVRSLWTAYAAVAESGMFRPCCAAGICRKGACHHSGSSM